MLPFNNISGDREQEYLADGIAEDIITGLSRQQWFSVVDRNSSFARKGEAVDTRILASELGVRYVLEGSVRKAGDRIRVTAQLVDATKRIHVWADRHDCMVADIFSRQDEITNRIVDSVRSQLVMMIVLAGAGIYSYLNLGRAEDPSFTIKVMIVNVSCSSWPRRAAARC